MNERAAGSRFSAPAWCLGEASNDMPTRRRYIFPMGCVMASFAYSTAAWELLFKTSLPILQRRQ
jgi:hypothetical protein